MTKVLRWGNSLAIKIPAPMARAVDLRHGSEVDVRREKEHLVVEPLRAAPTLEQLLAGVTAENQHREFEWPPLGQSGRRAP